MLKMKSHLLISLVSPKNRARLWGMCFVYLMTRIDPNQSRRFMNGPANAVSPEMSGVAPKMVT